MLVYSTTQKLKRSVNFLSNICVFGLLEHDRCTFSDYDELFYTETDTSAGGGKLDRIGNSASVFLEENSSPKPPTMRNIFITVIRCNLRVNKFGLIHIWSLNLFQTDN